MRDRSPPGAIASTGKPSPWTSAPQADAVALEDGHDRPYQGGVDPIASREPEGVRGPERLAAPDEIGHAPRMSNTGRFVWYELLTTDPKGAMAFYPEVIGWKTQPFGDAGDYTMWVGDQGPLGGVTELPGPAREMGAPPFWQANVEVADVDATVARVKALGGQVIHAEEVPTVGRFAVIPIPRAR